MDNLKKLNPHLDFSQLNTDDFLDLCSQYLSPYIDDTELLKNLESEIFNLIKSKEWEWERTDFHGANILAYSISGKSYDIVEYLLKNEKYNLTKYDESISEALSYCISLQGEKMLENILNNYPVDNLYINDMLLKSYSLASMMDEMELRNNFLEKANILCIKTKYFNGVINSFINKSEDYPDKNVLYHFLEQQKLSIEEKIELLQQYICPNNPNYKEPPQDISSIINSWINYHSLKNELNTNKEVNKKLKI